MHEKQKISLIRVPILQNKEENKAEIGKQDTIYLEQTVVLVLLSGPSVTLQKNVQINQKMSILPPNKSTDADKLNDQCCS